MEALHQLEYNQNELNRKQQTMLDLIKGNPLNRNDNGMLGKLEEIDLIREDVDGLVEDKKRIRWAVGMIVFFGGILWSIFQIVIAKFWK
jgi:hypothetical protein